MRECRPSEWMMAAKVGRSAFRVDATVRLRPHQSALPMLGVLFVAQDDDGYFLLSRALEVRVGDVFADDNGDGGLLGGAFPDAGDVIIVSGFRDFDYYEYGGAVATLAVVDNVSLVQRFHFIVVDEVLLLGVVRNCFECGSVRLIGGLQDLGAADVEVPTRNGAVSPDDPLFIDRVGEVTKPAVGLPLPGFQVGDVSLGAVLAFYDLGKQRLGVDAVVLHLGESGGQGLQFLVRMCWCIRSARAGFRSSAGRMPSKVSMGIAVAAAVIGRSFAVLVR